MPLTPESAKPALLDSMRDARKAQAAYAAIAALSIPGMLGTPLIAGVALVIVYVLERDRADSERLLAAPPRSDFRTPVRAKRRRYIASVDQSSFVTAADRFTERALDVAAYKEAILRADERAQGAALAGEHELEKQRLEDAQHALYRALEESERLRDAAERLASELIDGEAGRTIGGAMRSSLVASELTRLRATFDPAIVASQQARNYLDLSGLVVHDLAPSLNITDRDLNGLRSDAGELLASRTAAFAGSQIRAIGQIAADEGGGGEPPSSIVFL
jgi:hypothetical protein